MKKLKAHELISAIILKTSADPQLSELAGAVFDMWGGARGVAKKLVEEWDHARPGSMMRVKILDMLMQATRFVNVQNQRPANYTDLLTDEELDKELRLALDPLAGMIEYNETTDRPESGEEPYAGDAPAPDPP